MKQRTVISPLDLPTKLPISSTLLVWLCLSRFQPPGWVVGITWTVVAVVWGACVHAALTERSVRLEDLRRGIWR